LTGASLVTNISSMKKISIPLILLLMLIAACSYQSEKVQSYNKDQITKNQSKRKLAYINKYHAYYIKKRIPVTISGEIVKIDPFQNKWLFLLNKEEIEDQIMVDISQIPTLNRPIVKEGTKIKVYGSLIKDASLLTNYHLIAKAFLVESKQKQK